MCTKTLPTSAWESLLCHRAAFHPNSDSYPGTSSYPISKMAFLREGSWRKPWTYQMLDYSFQHKCGHVEYTAHVSPHSW